jgi:hypothetical protein
MTKPFIPVRLASLAMILGSLFGATPPLARAADDVGAGPDAPTGTPAVLYVDRSDDANITACTSAANDCTLRGAINKVNTDNLFDASIFFTATVSQVNLGASLPPLTTTGTSVVGPGKRINGAALSTGSMMTIDASGVEIFGLRFINGADRDISVLSGSRNEIEVVYSGAPDDTVNACLSTGVTRTSAVGIYVGPAVTGDSVTPSLWIMSSRVNCHALYGIQLDGADGVIIGVDRINGTPSPNYIGTDSSGDALGNGGTGIALLANGSNGSKNNQIRNNWIFDSGSQGILLRGTGTNNTNSTATNAITGNRIRGNGRLVTASGVRLMDGAFWNAIGGSAITDTNRIYGNTGAGIRIEDSELNGVLGNDIGGSPDFPGNNTGDGILIDGGKDNWIGGLFLLIGSSQAGNEIGGNDGDGIRLTNAARNTTIRRNLIGSDPYGTPRPNGASGISILSGSYSTTIGTGNSADLNVIAGNTLHGVRIDGAATTSNTIRYNDIGLNTNSALKCASPPCTAIVPNGGFGVVVQNGAHDNRAYDGNYIAHNGSGGIWVQSGAHDNQFGPSDEVFANTGSGFLFSDAQWNRISGMSIYSNTGDGIEQTSLGANNSWISTTTYLNGGLGIDIATTFEDNIPTAGFPVITSVVRAGGVVTVTGTSDTTFSGLTYRTTTVYLFHGGLDPSGYGEGQTLAGSANTNASGVWRVVYNDASTSRCYAAYKRVVAFNGATFTDAGSEFSLSTCTPKKAYVPMVLR